MIKILYFINNLKEAGAQKHLLEVIKTLDRDEFQPCLAVLDGSPTKVLDNIPVINLGVKRIYDISGIKGLFKLIKLMKRERFDIVHSYLFSENILGSIAAKIANVPVVVTSRRDTGMLYKRRFHYIWAYRLTNLLVDEIICVSEAVKKAVVVKEKIDAGKLEVIYNGVDVSKFTDAFARLRVCTLKKSLGINDNECVVGMVANFSWIKGHKDFIEAAQIVLKELPNTKFLLVGDGPLRSSLQSTVRNRQLENKILFLGVRKDIPELLSIMDISVNASYSEGMSNTILQSMASGVPVVATAVDGNLETVVDGVTGILIPPKNPQEMAEAIIKILKDKELANRMGENARKVVEEKFTNQIMLGNMEALYKRLLAPKVAFIFSQFPCYDETFILREMNALNEQGLNFLIFSLKTLRDKIVHSEAKNLAKDTVYTPFVSIKVILIQFYFLFRHPIKYLSTFIHIVKIHLRSSNFLVKSIALFPKSVYMARMMKRAKVRHIHAQWATHPATSAMIISRLTGIPFSITGHAHDIYVDTAGLKEKIGESKFVLTCTAYNKKYLLNLAGASARRRVAWLEDKIVVNYHGVDLEKFNGKIRSLLSTAYNHFRILSVGSLLPCKGFDILIEACKILRDKGVDFECTICGGGPLEKSLKSQVSSLKLEKEVKFTGYITQDKLIPLYRQTDVFALPLRREIHWGIPNVLLEAMASKVPVITVALPSMSELIEDGKTGFTVPEDNPQALAEMLMKLYKDSELRGRVGNLGYEIIAEKFNVKKNSQNLIFLFSDPARYTMNYELRADKILNVLYIIPSLELGGAERVVINLAKGLDKARYNPVVCCLNQKGEFAKELEQEGIRVIALNKKGKFDISVINKLVKVIRQNNIDIVNTHLWGANFWGRIAVLKAGVQVIIATEHNTDVWKSGLYFMFDRLLSKWTDRIIAVSNSVKEFYVSKGIAENKIEVIYNGIDINQGQSPAGTVPDLQRPSAKIREELGIKSDEKVLAVIGRLVPQKGHKYFLLAFKELVQEFRDSPLRGQSLKAIIVGTGPCENEIKQLSQSLGLNGSVIFTGLRKDVPQLLGGVDVVAMPSTREGLPIIALETMAAGVPIVATKVGGIPEVVIDGKTGLLVEPKNHVALKEAISRLLGEKALAIQLAENAKQKIEQEFTIKNMLGKTQALYETLYTKKSGCS